MKRLFVSLLLCLIMLVGCGESALARSSFMMDTVITYSLTNPGAAKIVNECDALIEKYENLLSAHIDDSLVSNFNKNGSAVMTSVPFSDIYSIAVSVYAQTNGAFDITVAPLVELWDVAHAGEGWSVPSFEDISSSLSHVGMDKLENGLTYLKRTDEKTKIDLGGIAKGYALGAVLEHIKYNYSAAYGTVSFGGNIALVGKKPDGSVWSVGVKNPFDTSGVIGTLSLDSGIVSVSGSYERFAEADGIRYHHIIDPKTGYPSASDLVSVAVWVDTSDPFCDYKNAGAYADALSTALFVMGHDAAVAHYFDVRDGLIQDYAVENLAFEAVLIKADGTVTVTDGLLERYTPYE